MDLQWQFCANCAIINQNRFTFYVSSLFFNVPLITFKGSTQQFFGDSCLASCKREPSSYLSATHKRINKGTAQVSGAKTATKSITNELRTRLNDVKMWSRRWFPVTNPTAKYELRSTQVDIIGAGLMFSDPTQRLLALGFGESAATAEHTPPGESSVSLFYMAYIRVWHRNIIIPKYGNWGWQDMRVKDSTIWWSVSSF